MTTMHLRTVVEVFPSEAVSGISDMMAGWRDAGWSIQSISLCANAVGLVALERSGLAAEIEAERDRNLAGTVAGHHRGARAVMAWMDGQPPPTVTLWDFASESGNDRLCREMKRAADALEKGYRLALDIDNERRNPILDESGNPAEL